MDPQQLTQHLNTAVGTHQVQDYAQAALALAQGYQQQQQQQHQQQQQQFIANPQQYQQYAQVQQYQQQMQQYTQNPQQYAQQYAQTSHALQGATASSANGLLQPGRPKGPAMTKKGKAKDPNRPKRPTSAYFFFLASKREEAKIRGQNISKVAEWTKQVSAIWREMSPGDKENFETLAKADKKRYEMEKQSYSGRRPKDKNRPKRPQSSYFCFLGVYREKNKSNFTGEGAHKLLIKAAAEEWNSLGPADKVPYEHMAEEEKRKYEHVMKIYNAGGLPGGLPQKKETSSTSHQPQQQPTTTQQHQQQPQQHQPLNYGASSSVMEDDDDEDDEFEDDEGTE